VIAIERRTYSPSSAGRVEIARVFGVSGEEAFHYPNESLRAPRSEVLFDLLFPKSRSEQESWLRRWIAGCYTATIQAPPVRCVRGAHNKAALSDVGWCTGGEDV